MKFNLETQLLDLNGEPATQTTPLGIDDKGNYKGFKEIKLTVGLVIKTALNYTDKETKPDLAKLVERGKKILSINKNVSPDFNTHELTDLKDQMVKAGFDALVIAQMDEIIETKPSSPKKA